MADKFDAELERIRSLLREALEANRYSIRALEREMGTTVGVTRKVLSGQISLSYRRVLEIVDALGLSWTDFFQAAYPREHTEAPAEGMTTAARLGRDEPKRVNPVPVPAPQAPEDPALAALRARVKREVIADLLRALLDDNPSG